MTYTEEAKQALSRKVAEKFGIEPSKEVVISIGLGSGIELQDLWLHDDWHTICELCVKHGVNVYHDHEVTSDVLVIGMEIKVPYSDCNGDPSLAERIARLLALLEV